MQKVVPFDLAEVQREDNSWLTDFTLPLSKAQRIFYVF